MNNNFLRSEFTKNGDPEMSKLLLNTQRQEADAASFKTLINELTERFGEPAEKATLQNTAQATLNA